MPKQYRAAPALLPASVHRWAARGWPGLSPKPSVRYVPAGLQRFAVGVDLRCIRSHRSWSHHHAIADALIAGSIGLRLVCPERSSAVSVSTSALTVTASQEDFICGSLKEISKRSWGEEEDQGNCASMRGLLTLLPATAGVSLVAL